MVHARYGDVHLGQALVLFQEGVEVGVKVALEAAADAAVLKNRFGHHELDLVNPEVFPVVLWIGDVVGWPVGIRHSDSKLATVGNISVL